MGGAGQGRFAAWRDDAGGTNVWQFEEARKLIDRLGGAGPAYTPEKGYVLFETGYGPSGLPHIGTFGEVVRTTMVRHAFQVLSDIPTRLFCFSDDMDGLRKVPDNVPNRDMLAQHLEKPLTQVPDPFGKYPSFGQHNNARLRAFLDGFGFEYEFKSATECYTSGLFDPWMVRVAERYDQIMEIMLPSLREERQKSYSPFLPVCPRTGRVLQVPIEEVRPADATVVYRDPDTGALTEVSIMGGRCKLQWKPDWGMRWAALGVDYEMSGKDLIDSVKLSSRITKALGGRAPEGFNYELFLDEKGEKISKSRGNGLSVEEWLTYGPPESLALFMATKPKTAKKLYFDVIPKTVDDYQAALADYPALAHADQPKSQVWHIHDGAPPSEPMRLAYSMILNLASAANAVDAAVLWGFISRYVPEATPQSAPFLDRLVGYALAYYRDFVKPAKRYRAPTAQEAAALDALAGALRAAAADASAEDLQNIVYEIGKTHGFEPLRDWFKAIYEVLLGQAQGPRFGSFIALYGRDETCALIDKALRGEDLSAA
ncbi:MAG: lysine--tRNA ligase [Alphaproteobacteria bacterium]